MQQQKKKNSSTYYCFHTWFTATFEGCATSKCLRSSDSPIHAPPLRNIFTFFFLSKLGSASTTQLYSVRCCSCFLKEDMVLYGWHAMLRFESRRRHRRQQICFGFKRDVEKRQCLGSSYFGLAANNCSLC